MLTIYTKPHCPNCEAAKQHLINIGVGFEMVDITVDDAAYSFIIGEGHRSVPQFYEGKTNICSYAELMTMNKEQLTQLIQDLT